MAFNLLDAAKSLLPNDLVSQAATSLDESESNLQSGLSAAIPSLFGGLLKNASTNSSGILDLVKNASSSNVYNNLYGLFDNTGTGGGFAATIMGWLRSILGDRLGNVVSAIASFAGIKSSSSNSILSLAVPALLGAIGRHVQSNNLNAGGLLSFLREQKDNVLSSAPSGFNVKDALGISSLDDLDGREATARVEETRTHATEYVDHNVKRGGTNWLWPLLLLLALAALIWWLTTKGCKTEDTVTTTDGDTTEVMTPTVPEVSGGVKGTYDSTKGYIYDVGANTEIKLPDGTTMTVGENSTEAKLHKMITDANWAVNEADKSANWVTFDRVYFETGKSVLTAESQAQIKNIGAILKNYPNAAIKIGGYTDNSGDAAINKKISDDRAKIVMREVVANGAAAKQVTEAVGYGPEHPVCPANDTPECMAQNRRVDLKVASK